MAHVVITCCSCCCVHVCCLQQAAASSCSKMYTMQILSSICTCTILTACGGKLCPVTVTAALCCKRVWMPSWMPWQQSAHQTASQDCSTGFSDCDTLCTSVKHTPPQGQHCPKMQCSSFELLLAAPVSLTNANPSKEPARAACSIFVVYFLAFSLNVQDMSSSDMKIK